MSGWLKTTLGEVTTFQRGFDLPVGDRTNSGFPVVASTGVVGRHNQAQVASPGIVIGRSGSIGGGQFLTEPFWPLNTTLWVKDFHGNDERFCFYLIKNIDFSGFNVGSGVPTLNRNHIHPLPVVIPPLAEQREIASILGALDDKIELNRRMSATLEDMARSLYRSWFVDFDPVHAKIDGRQPAFMDEATAALFPDRFGDDGLPEDWNIETFGDFYQVLETGRRPKGGIKDISDGVPSIGAESVKRIGTFDFAKTKLVPHDFFKSMKKGVLADGDILVYKDGGKPGQLRPAATYVSKGFPFEQACINEHVFRIRMKEGLGQHFGFLAISSESCFDQMRELATGVAQPGLNQAAMNALKFVLPADRKVLDAFNAAAQPLLDGCNERAAESFTLAALRDSLLPKLMSGEIRVCEAREHIEEVA